MRKIKIILWVMTSVIGLMAAASLNGWRLDDYTVPKNRTSEQYDFEGAFEPMFKFLEQDKKDFTGLKLYKSSVYIEKGDEVKDYEIRLDTTQSDIKGDYTITIGDKEETVPETFDSAETELRDIIYKPENQSELFKHLKNKYDLSEDTTCRIRLDHSSGTIYGISILMESKEKAVQIDLTIFKE